MLFWPEISALGVFFNFDNERMHPPKYPSAPPGLPLRVAAASGLLWYMGTAHACSLIPTSVVPPLRNNGPISAGRGISSTSRAHPLGAQTHPWNYPRLLLGNLVKWIIPDLSSSTHTRTNSVNGFYHRYQALLGLT